MTPKAPAIAKQLARFLKQGEGVTLEFKRSTGELKEGMQTVCAFLNGSGGTVLFGVRPNGAAEGQEVSDQTLRDIAQAADRFEPVVTFRVRVGSTAEVGAQVAAEVSAQVTAEVAAQVVAFCRDPQPAKAIMAELGLKHWKTFQTNYLAPLIQMGILARTIPDEPRSSRQKYRLTEKGRQILEQRKGDAR